MKYEKFADTIGPDTLTSATWDNARRNAEIERAAIISAFFKQLFSRKEADVSQPAMQTAVAGGGHDQAVLLSK